ncbi:MAG: DMT family transporter [Pseudomonadota bacterium]
MKRNWLLYLGLLGVALFWGNVFVANKYLLQHTTPLHLAALRMIPAGALFGLFLLALRRAPMMALLRDVRWKVLWLCLFGTVLNTVTMTIGQQAVPGGTGSLVASTNPLFTFILSALFLGERPTLKKAFGLALAFTGVLIIVRWAGGQRVDVPYLLGFLVLLCSPFFWAIFTVMAKPIIARHDPLVVVATTTALGAVPFLFFLADGRLIEEAGLFPLSAWLSVAFLSVIATVLAFILWFSALKRLQATQVAVFLYFVPAVGVTFSKLLLDEPITLPLILGGLIILSGVALINRG